MIDTQSTRHVSTFITDAHAPPIYSLPVQEQVRLLRKDRFVILDITLKTMVMGLKKEGELHYI